MMYRTSTAQPGARRRREPPTHRRRQNSLRLRRASQELLAPDPLEVSPSSTCTTDSIEIVHSQEPAPSAGKDRVSQTYRSRCRTGVGPCPAGDAKVPEPRCRSGAETPQRRRGSLSGGDGTRTHDPYIANVVLYQLSYTPEGVRSYRTPPDATAGVRLSQPRAVATRRRSQPSSSSL